MTHMRRIAPPSAGAWLTVPPVAPSVMPVASRPAVHAPARWGVALVVFFVLAFGSWGCLVPLDGGAVAPGVVNPDSGKKTIQHLEGGIVAELPVREGERVKAGQPLVVLESTQARAAHETLVQQQLSLLARKARLEAERAGLSRIAWPAELRAAQANIKPVLDAQQEVFDTRRQTHASRREILAQRIEQLLHQIRGYEAQVLSASKQIGFVAEELSAKEYLVRRGLIPKPEALRLRRTDAEISGKMGEYEAEIARGRQQIGEARLQILAVDAERADQIAGDFEKVRGELADVNEKLLASADVVRRTVVAAPVDGTVVDIKFKTLGGVVQRGEPILSIVPGGRRADRRGAADAGRRQGRACRPRGPPQPVRLVEPVGAEDSRHRPHGLGRPADRRGDAPALLPGARRRRPANAAAAGAGYRSHSRHARRGAGRDREADDARLSPAAVRRCAVAQLSGNLTMARYRDVRARP